MAFEQIYRPFTLNEVAGQASAVHTLRGKVDKPSGTYLLYGPYGTGKTTLARIFARMINCADLDRCTRESPCPSCQVFLEGKRHPDITEMNAAESRGIDDARALIETSRLYPTFKCRVAIIDEGHQFTPQAQQCLLKPLEEPGKHMVWILCTTDKDKLLSTISSRATQLKLSLLSDGEIVQTIKRVADAESLTVPDPVIKAIINAAGGHARDALKALDTYAAALRGGGVADIEKMAKQIEAASPSVLAFSYVQGIFAKEAQRAFAATMMAENKGRFLEDVIDALRLCIYMTSGAQTLAQQHRNFNRVAGLAQNPRHVPVYAYFLDQHVQALAQLKQYTMREQDVLDGVAAKCFGVPAV